MREARVFYFRSKVGESPDSPLLFLDNVQPAKPFFFALIGPQERITGPKLFNLAVGLPILERGFDSASQIGRQRKILLVDVRCDGRLLVIARAPRAPRLKFGGFQCMEAVRFRDP